MQFCPLVGLTRAAASAQLKQPAIPAQGAGGLRFKQPAIPAQVASSPLAQVGGSLSSGCQHPPQLKQPAIPDQVADSNFALNAPSPYRSAAVSLILPWLRQGHQQYPSTPRLAQPFCRPRPRTSVECELLVLPWPRLIRSGFSSIALVFRSFCSKKHSFWPDCIEKRAFVSRCIPESPDKGVSGRVFAPLCVHVVFSASLFDCFWSKRPKIPKISWEPLLGGSFLPLGAASCRRAPLLSACSVLFAATRQPCCLPHLALCFRFLLPVHCRQAPELYSQSIQPVAICAPFLSFVASCSFLFALAPGAAASFLPRSACRPLFVAASLLPAAPARSQSFAWRIRFSSCLLRLFLFEL